MTISDTFKLVTACMEQVTSLFSSSTVITQKEVDLVEPVIPVIVAEQPVSVSPMDLFRAAQKPAAVVIPVEQPVVHASVEQDQGHGEISVPVITHAVVMEPVDEDVIVHTVAEDVKPTVPSLQEILATRSSLVPVITQIPQSVVSVIQPVVVSDTVTRSVTVAPVVTEAPVAAIKPVVVTTQEVPAVSSSSTKPESLEATHKLHNKKWKGRRSATPTLVMNYKVEVSGQPQKK